MHGALATMIFTDPPYNVRIDGHASGLGAIRHREFAMASGEMDETEFKAFLTSSCALLTKNSIDGAIHFVCMDWRHIYELMTVGREIYSELKNICVWVKNNGGMGSFYRSRHELVLVFKQGGGSHRNNVQLGRFGRNRTNVWEYPGANSLGRGTEEGNLLALHPTVKPAAMVADAILDCSARGDVILDAFLGSGTTVIAAERTGRRCYGLELEPGYADTISFADGRHSPAGTRGMRQAAGALTSSPPQGSRVMPQNDEPEEKVGYRKPPRRTQFKKGQSGNPKGRPRKSKNFATLLRATA
jgi:DNA modification methylase